MSQEIIDLSDVLDRVQGDKDLLLELLDIFQEDFLKKRQDLHAAFEAKDLEKIQMAVHSIKGSSGNISITRMHATCIDLENILKQKKTEGMDVLIRALDDQFEQVKAYVLKLKKEWGQG